MTRVFPHCWNPWSPPTWVLTRRIVRGTFTAGRRIRWGFWPSTPLTPAMSRTARQITMVRRHLDMMDLLSACMIVGTWLLRLEERTGRARDGPTEESIF